jgi:hypothetical protein
MSALGNMTKKPPINLPSKKRRSDDEAPSREAEMLERAFLVLSESAFEEWNGAEDEATFRYL